MIRPILVILDAITEIDQDAAYKFCDTFRRKLKEPEHQMLAPNAGYYFGDREYYVKFVDDVVFVYKEKKNDKGAYDLLGESVI